MDRTNLGAANIAGFVISSTACRKLANNIFPSMAKGLKLIGNRYRLIVLIFFIPYVLFQPPVTVVLRKVGPRRFLTAITLLWGDCMIVRLPLQASLTQRMDSVLSSNGNRCLASVASWVFSKQVSSLAVLISSQCGIHDTSCKSATQFSISSAAWLPLSLAFSPMGSCK
jgi:hypothetical protein